MHGIANLNYLTHAFVPQNIPFAHGGNTAIIEMDI
jgi:hypothetical protein